MPNQTILSLATHGQGLYEFTREAETWVNEQSVNTGVCHLFIRHTSCSLTIQENANPSAKTDLENWLNRLVPENDPLYTHTMEGPDDMPAHIKAILTNVSLSIPIFEGRLALGTWQGLYLWEHRHQSHSRSVILHISS